MKSNEEFKSEVYARAETKQKQIRLQRRRIAVMIPCIAIVVLAAAVSFGFMDLSSLQIGDSADSAPPEAENMNDVNELQSQSDFEIYTAEYETAQDLAGNTAQKPEGEPDGATVGDDYSAQTTVSGTPPASSSDYLCIRIFEVEAKTQEPYVTAQVIDSHSELEAYFKANKCDGSKSFYSFYTNTVFDGRFFIAVNMKGYVFKEITQTDETIEIRVERNENGDSNAKATLNMLPLFEKQYDKTKRIDIIK